MNRARELGEMIFDFAEDVQTKPNRKAWLTTALAKTATLPDPDTRDLGRGFVIFCVALADALDRGKAQIDRDRKLNAQLAELLK